MTGIVRSEVRRAPLALVLALAAATVSAQTPETSPDDAIFTFLLIDQLEHQSREGADGLAWEVEGWIGGDYDKVWLKTEGERAAGEGVEEAEVQVLYSRLVSPFWELQAGVRHDFEPTSRTHAVLGVQGLAPYWFEVEAAAFLSERGDLTARVDVEYELLLTQRLILQPLAEISLAAQDVEELGIGAGFTDMALGLRLRYELQREFAPYVGVTWSRRLGESAGLAREEGEDVEEFAVVAGLRVWY